VESPVSSTPQPVLRQKLENTPDPEEIPAEVEKDDEELSGINSEEDIDHPEKILSNALPNRVYQTEAVVSR
jgi:hypothetical protein